MRFLQAVVLLASTVTVRPDSDVFRVSKGLGAHGYGSLRASVISDMDSTQPDNEFYTYNAQFKYRW
jgi:hypothetical protein